MRRALAILACLACAPKAAPPPPRLAKIDVHTHFGPAAVPNLLRIMDANGIDAVVNLSGSYAGEGLEEQLAAAAAAPGRIFVFANLDWDEAERGPGYGARMAEGLRRAKALGARGLKIPKGLGLFYRDFRRALIAVDDPELDVVFETAAALGFPVALHVGDPVAFWRPPTSDNERYAELVAHPGWSFYGKEVPSWEELFAALERRIARHPRTTFISVHFGNAAEYPERVAALLDKYPNLYIDTAARIPEMGRHDAAHDPEKVRALFVRFQDRILFGTDLAVGRRPLDLMLGSSGRDPPTQADVDRFFSATWRYFETNDRQFDHPTPIQGDWKIDGIGLPPEVLRKVYGENARRLLGLKNSP
ncbi:MAG TPA: amidohydrolase family protein [Haliangiales bacterium]|nr:amidohydrolase family protein [Haliangiales bacterium]